MELSLRGMGRRYEILLGSAICKTSKREPRWRTKTFRFSTCLVAFDRLTLMVEAPKSQSRNHLLMTCGWNYEIYVTDDRQQSPRSLRIHLD
jgi:hypothetical protein